MAAAVPNSALQVPEDILGDEAGLIFMSNVPIPDGRGWRRLAGFIRAYSLVGVSLIDWLRQ